MTTTTDTSIETIHDTLPAIECAPWCEYDTGHADADALEDQWCWGPTHVVKLTRMPVRSFYGKDGLRDQWLDNLNVFLARQAEGVTHVAFHRDEDRGVQVTIGEVEELRERTDRAPGGRTSLTGPTLRPMPAGEPETGGHRHA